MAFITLEEQIGVTTPAANKGRIYIDTTLNQLFLKDDAGRYWGRSHNASVANQAGFAADTYVTNSGLLIPSFSMQAKTMFEWRLSASKTAAGVATPILQVRIGVNQTTADTSRLTLTGPAQTAAADVGILTVVLVCRNVAAAGVLQGHMSWSKNGAAVGFANNDAGAVEGTSAGFDNTALGGSFIGLSINGGASAAWTVTQVRAEAIW
jgi:hypothetical protein